MFRIPPLGRRRKAENLLALLAVPFTGDTGSPDAWSASRTGLAQTFRTSPAAVEGVLHRDVVWRIPGLYSVELHGHSFVLLDSQLNRRAEVLIDSSGPAALSHENPDPQSGGYEIRLAVRADHQTTVLVNVNGSTVVDRGLGDPANGWHTWTKGNRSLTYILDEPLSSQGKNRLAVVFSALGAPYDFTYNYRSSLSHVDSYRLYITDNFGSRGSYYYADHRDTGIFDSVQEFLTEVLNSLGVELSHTTFAGSSKGGTAALSHGLRIGAGQIVVGAPQCFPGAYLQQAAPDILEFIAGDSSAESVSWLDKIIPESIALAQGAPRVTVLVGENDSHLHVHIKPYCALAGSAGLETQVKILSGLTHQDIGAALGPYLGAALGPAAPASADLLPFRFEWREDAENEVQLKLWLFADESTAVMMTASSGEVLVDAPAPSDRTYYKVSVPPGGSVRALITRYGSDTELPIGSFHTDWLVPKG